MGPLEGLKVVEFAGIGPAPMAAMLLAEQGASVLRLERPGTSDLGLWRPRRFDLLLRGRPAIVVDLKSEKGRALALSLVERADAVIEGFRPGVMERLALGPEVCLEKNPRLAYGRVTGWGQDGPLAQAAGHDLNYIALSGALDALGRQGSPPTPPLNILGDFAGGAMYLAFGILCAVFEARRSGKGQVVDAAMVDGAASLMTAHLGMLASGIVQPERGTNFNDTGAHFYEVYECADGRFITIAAIEGKFYAELLRRIGLDPSALPPQLEREGWPQAKERLQAIFKTKTREEWCALLEGTDSCFAPVLNFEEAAKHPHMAERGIFVEIDGISQPAPAPRFSRSAAGLPQAPREPDPASSEKALADWLDPAAAARLRADGVFG